MRRGALLLLALAACPLAAQDAAPTPKPPVVVRPAPMLAMPNPRPARVMLGPVIDIPQAAKDAGHNGNATYLAVVGPDGTLLALKLIDSSNSPAIDEAVKIAALSFTYLPATDKDGKKVESTTELRMGYARYDRRSPGGGISAYTCGDLVREWDWFTAANAGRRKLFWPHNAYTSLESIEAMRAGEIPSREARAANRAKREKMWASLIKRCRKTPARLMLDEVDQPQAYANLVNTF